MRVEAKNIVIIRLSDRELSDAVLTAHRIVGTIIDRWDLHERDYLERFIDSLLGEIAERMVLRWLKDNGKFAESAVDKKALTPDVGHDIWLKNLQGEQICASIKSSISVLKNNPGDILQTFTLATKPKELRDVNIQVCFWLDPFSSPRTNVPTMQQAAIMAWALKEDLVKEEFIPYTREEQRTAPAKRLCELRAMGNLLSILS